MSRKGRTRRIPDSRTADVLELYFVQNLTTYEIGCRLDASHQAVANTIRSTGAELRPRGRVATVECRIDGCDQPVERVRHGTTGRMYGTLCKEHCAQHARRNSRTVMRRRLGITPDREENYRLKEPENEEHHCLQKGKALLQEITALLALRSRERKPRAV